MIDTVTQESLSAAWLAAARLLADKQGAETYDLIVEILNPAEEVPCIREPLDRHLAANGKQSIETVANTIFPRRLWRPEMGRPHFYESYRRMLPKLHKFSGNHHGLYFERLINWRSDDGQKMNQVEEVIEKLRGELTRPNALRFIYDLLVFSPVQDRRPLGFPCLSYVNVKLHAGRLLMTAHYRNHYFVERAYGNYLGLARLQSFFAQQCGIEPGRIVCISGHAVLDDHRKVFRQLLSEL